MYSAVLVTMSTAISLVNASIIPQVMGELVTEHRIFIAIGQVEGVTPSSCSYSTAFQRINVMTTKDNHQCQVS